MHGPTRHGSLAPICEDDDLDPGPASRNRPLTERQEKFVQYCVDGIPQGKAAELAGYSHPHNAGYVLMQVPKVTDAIARRAAALIEGKLVPAAIQCLYEVITNPKAPAAARVSASHAALERSRHTAKVAPLPPAPAPLPGEGATLEELDAFIAFMERRRSAEMAEDAEIVKSASGESASS